MISGKVYECALAVSPQHIEDVFSIENLSRLPYVGVSVDKNGINIKNYC